MTLVLYYMMDINFIFTRHQLPAPSMSIPMGERREGRGSDSVLIDRGQKLGHKSMTMSQGTTGSLPDRETNKTASANLEHFMYGRKLFIVLAHTLDRDFECCMNYEVGDKFGSRPYLLGRLRKQHV